MMWLCLVAASAGTPLRQAEAADDAARALDRSGDHDLATVDGGVGDEPGDTIRDGDGAGHVPPDSTPSPSPSSFIPAPTGPAPAGPGPGDRAPGSPAGSPRRQAWLHRFRF